MDARLRLRKRWGRGNNSNNMTDARQLLMLKQAIQRRKNHVSPMNASSFRPKNQVVQQNRNFVSYKKTYRNNQNFVANTNNFRGRFTNRRFVNRNNFVNRRTAGNPMQNQGFRHQNVSRFTGGRNKRVYSSSRGGITITTQNRSIITNDDDLENMTLDDLTGVHGANLPHGIATNSLSSLTSPSVSGFSHLPPVDTMIADSYLGNHGGSAKLMVTDLLPSVSQEDIVELFSNVGPLIRVEILTPGKVLIQYASANDAQTAAETYNGVLLDGQAMKCNLIQSYDDGHHSLASRLGEKPIIMSSRIQIPQPSSSMMFPVASSSRSFHAPKEPVRFTVKLP